MIDWEAVRDTYVERFGPLHKSNAVKTFDREPTEDDLATYARAMALKETLCFFLLCFRRSELSVGPIIYASFGAVQGGAGNEVFLMAAVPYAPFMSAVEELARTVPRDIEPLSVVQHDVRLTSFDAMLVAPASDGTFALGMEEGSLRRALRLVPITRAERGLAARDPERLIDLLRAAGALVADPLRACVVEPEGDPARRANAAALLADTQRTARRAAEHHERMCAFGPPEEFLLHAEQHAEELQSLLAFLEARVPSILPEPDAPELLSPEARDQRFAAMFRETLRFTLDPYAGLVPPRVGQLLRVFMILALATHPLVHRVVYEAMTAPGRRPEKRGLDDQLMTELLMANVVALLIEAVPTASRRKLVTRGKEVVDEAGRTFTPASDLPWELHAWSSIVPALCVDAADLGVAQSAAVEHALREAAELASGVDLEPGFNSGPPRTRLLRIASGMSKGLYRDYLRAVRQMLREGAARRQGLRRHHEER